MKKLFLLCLTGIAVALQASAEVRVAGKWGQAVKNDPNQSVALASGVVAKEGDILVLTYATNKKGAFEFNIASADGRLSEETRYEKTNGAVSGIVYYRVDVGGLFDLSAYQADAVYATYGAYHLSSTVGDIKELAHGAKMVGTEGASGISNAYYWGGTSCSGVLVEGVSSYGNLGIPAETESVAVDQEKKRISSVMNFHSRKNITMNWSSVAKGGKGNFALAGVVFVDAEPPPALLGFLIH
jgi:hypothetical protein